MISLADLEPEKVSISDIADAIAEQLTFARHNGVWVLEAALVVVRLPFCDCFFPNRITGCVRCPDRSLFIFRAHPDSAEWLGAQNCISTSWHVLAF